jgi:hypothetical protein
VAQWLNILNIQKSRKLAGNNSTGPFPEFTLEELVFLHHKYHSIFLLQQEASAYEIQLG